MHPIFKAWISPESGPAKLWQATVEFRALLAEYMSWEGRIKFTPVTHRRNEAKRALALLSIYMTYTGGSVRLAKRPRHQLK